MMNPISDLQDLPPSRMPSQEWTAAERAEVLARKLTTCPACQSGRVLATSTTWKEVNYICSDCGKRFTSTAHGLLYDNSSPDKNNL